MLKGSSLTLDSPLNSLPGIGPILQARLAAQGVLQVEDLLLLSPRRYSDRRDNTAWEALKVGEEATVEGVVVRLSRPRGRRGRQLHVALAETKRDVPRLWCRWYRHPPTLDAKDKHKVLRVCGVPRDEDGQLVMSHPEIVGADEPGVIAEYSALGGIPGRSLRRWVGDALAGPLRVSDPIPPQVLEVLNLPTRSEALRVVHQRGPTTEPSLTTLSRLSAGEHPAARRLAFEELYLLALAAALRRRAWRQGRAKVCHFSLEAREHFIASLPFTPTREQEQALGEIWSDMECSAPMLRLLQGDVGSGKTLVAFGACLAAVAGGARAVLLAPTAVLARQHYATLCPLCHPQQLRLGLVTREVEEGAGFRGDIVVGTHSLLNREADLQPLGLVVIDEEHRFGVHQRQALGQRGEEVAHRLMMSATPIPRSLALTLYGDMDSTVLAHGPPGRQPVETRRFGQGTISAGSEAAWVLGRRLEAGEQAVVVCPLRAPSPQMELADATTAAARLVGMFPACAVGLVHGGLHRRQRETVMQAFIAGETQLLVATTIVEVGVDAPFAQVMVVEHAERFGLAQLHQLRGRVGRRQPGALCMLLAAPEPGSRADERLTALVDSTDGFLLAEVDLWQRGPGEMLGAQQAGMPQLRWANLRRDADQALMESARCQARWALAEDPLQEQNPGREAHECIRRRWGEHLLVAGALIR
ncbi:MAG: ATP-dependent DNA helicase RecG [Deltaproteobacteria bacterium]|nr:ATP-dependent DNA helicase RecG [Deltaproteobacteria bacterium]